MKKYTGNKAIPGVYQKIINEIPKHSTYVEAFAGSAAIGLLLPGGTTLKIFNDLNRDALQSIAVPAGHAVIKTIEPASELIQKLSKRSGTETFIFCDPPYLHDTRHSDKLYKFEMTVNDHEEFLTVAAATKCNCMIIHPACQMYDDILQSWRTIQIKIRYNKKTSIENLYMNYPKQELQTQRYAGTDCWDRQRIKRKAARFIAKGPTIKFPERTYIEDTLNL